MSQNEMETTVINLPSITCNLLNGINVRMRSVSEYTEKKTRKRTTTCSKHRDFYRNNSKKNEKKKKMNLQLRPVAKHRR